MNQKKKHELKPMLRFPEFRDCEEWKRSKLGSLGTIISGLTYSPEDIRDKGLLVLRSSNVQDNTIVLDDCVYVTPDIKGANLSEANDILICVRNGSTALIGKSAIIPGGMPLCTHGAFMTVIRAKRPHFVYQLLQSPAYKSQVAADLGARINSINSSNLINYEFAVPTLPEQHKIADCLSLIDHIIAIQVKKTVKLKVYKSGLIKRLFPAEGEAGPQLRFPEFQDAPKWKERRIGDLLFEEQRPVEMKDEEEYSLVTVKRRYGGVVPRCILRTYP